MALTNINRLIPDSGFNSILKYENNKSTLYSKLSTTFNVSPQKYVSPKKLSENVIYFFEELKISEFKTSINFLKLYNYIIRLLDEKDLIISIDQVFDINTSISGNVKIYWKYEPHLVDNESLLIIFISKT